MSIVNGCVSEKTRLLSKHYDFDNYFRNFKKLLKKYKYYIHLKYLRELFVKNKGNSITYRAT